MSDLPAEVDETAAGDPPDPTERPSVAVRRDADLLGRTNSACRKYLTPKIETIIRGFEEQAARSDDLDQWWNIFNCELDAHQFYNGNAQVYVPIIRDAVNARATRFANQLFPQSGRYVDATSTDGKLPWEIVALVNFYIDDARLKTSVVRPLLRAGDIEGQYNLYVDWQEQTRHIVSRETRAPIDPQTGMESGEDEITDIVEEEVALGRPVFEVLHDSDVLVLPATVDSVDEALATGGSVTIVRRWSKERYEDMVKKGEVRGADEPRELDPNLAGLSDIEKKLARSVGVRAKGRHIVVFETWLMVPLNDKGSYAEKGDKRLCRMWWGIDKEALGLRRNPYWNDRCPLLSAPVEKLAGVFKGKSLVEPLAPLQYEANDAANERADADHYGAMPIIVRRPGEGNPPLILNLAAVWDASPEDIKFMEFPDLSRRATERIMAATQIIFQSLGINPAMMPQQTGRPGAKRNQAEVALEQSVDLLTVAEAVEVPDQQILTPLVAWIVDLDHQFRVDRELTIRAFGELGVAAEMIDVPPLQNRTHYRFQWAGAQQAKLNAAMLQQGTGLLNVARGLGPQLQQEGYQLRLGPALERAFINVYGAEVGRLTLVDQRHQLAMMADLENDMLADGFTLHTHPLDNDPEHIKVHREAMMEGDPHGTIRVHLQEHLQAMQMKAIAAMQQQQPQPGGGGPAGPGAPQPGAQPQGARMLRGPPGAVHPDQMARMGGGAVPMPRKA